MRSEVHGLSLMELQNMHPGRFCFSQNCKGLTCRCTVLDRQGCRFPVAWVTRSRQEDIADLISTGTLHWKVQFVGCPESNRASEADRPTMVPSISISGEESQRWNGVGVSCQVVVVLCCSVVSVAWWCIVVTCLRCLWWFLELCRSGVVLSHQTVWSIGRKTAIPVET